MSTDPNGQAGSAAAATASDGGNEVEATAVDLEEFEQELVLSDLDALLPTLDGARHDRFSQLRDAVDLGRVPVPLVPALESVLELTLQTARARARHHADGERALTDLYRRTTAGRQLAAHLGQVNKALKSLQGQTIESVSVRMRTVGHFTIAVQTDRSSITLSARPDAVNVESVGVGT